MKKNLKLIGVWALVGVCGPAGIGAEHTHPIFPRLDSWAGAEILMNELIPGTRLQVVVGRTYYFGGPSILGVHVLRGQKLIQSTSYSSTEFGSPRIENEAGRVSLRMPSGLLLLEILKEPDQPPEPMAVLRPATAQL